MSVDCYRQAGARNQRVTRRMVAAGVDALQGVLGGWGRLTIFDEECVQAIFRAMVQASRCAVPTGKGICCQSAPETHLDRHSAASETQNLRPSSLSKRDA
jgi:hypothetical protein